ncbi:PREDICTED: EG45-like domain containing protein 2 [Theobroma cacao]|uniref:EG45-like domain containing protein 2 n=2 Tax=Theobroma cacao TaxID=3641 RepID=A0AB32WLM9_THECC|nr:PREDICTED: EG45-like domain containing protein 2 [Theobroma cacao]EOY26483.1 Plant natriuretic peptide A [Theobroma cacao]
MALLVLAIMIAAAISKEVYFVHGDIGTASFYNPPYIPTKCDGNREEQFPPGNLFVAVSEGLWDNGAACGRRYRLRCLSGPQRPCKHRTIDVKVVDFCPVTPCLSTMMLSRDAFAAIAHQHGRKINIEYIQV